MTLIGIRVVIMDVNIAIALPLITAAIIVLSTAITQAARAIVAISALAPVVAAVAVLISVIAWVVPLASSEAVAIVAVAWEEIVFGLYVLGEGWMARLGLCSGKN
jgi:hypothetical protein